MARSHPPAVLTAMCDTAHLGILAQELAVRTAGGRSLETSLAEKYSEMKNGTGVLHSDWFYAKETGSLRAEHVSIGQLHVLLL